MLRLKTISLLGHLGELDTLPEGKLLINTINAHSYNTARKDAAFAEALLKGDVLIPDGASIVLAFKLLRHEKIERIAGWDLFQYEMKKLNAKGGTCFFLGSSEGTLQKIKAKAAGLYPNIRIETYSPPYKAEFSEEDNRRMIEAVNRVTPDLLWVGNDCPQTGKVGIRTFERTGCKRSDRYHRCCVRLLCGKYTACPLMVAGTQP